MTSVHSLVPMLPEAGHMQGKMIGDYVLENYDTVDLNGDGRSATQCSWAS